jgi:hypothetical protein
VLLEKTASETMVVAMAAATGAAATAETEAVAEVVELAADEVI